MPVQIYDPNSPADRAAIRARLAHLAAGAAPRVKADPAREAMLAEKARSTGRSLASVALEQIDIDFAAARVRRAAA